MLSSLMFSPRPALVAGIIACCAPGALRAEVTLTLSATPPLVAAGTLVTLDIQAAGAPPGARIFWRVDQMPENDEAGVPAVIACGQPHHPSHLSSGPPNPDPFQEVRPGSYPNLSDQKIFYKNFIKHTHI
jgi:hypothetical protein